MFCRNLEYQPDFVVRAAPGCVEEKLKIVNRKKEGPFKEYIMENTVVKTTGDKIMYGFLRAVRVTSTKRSNVRVTLL